MQTIQFYNFDLSQSAKQRWGPIFDVYQDKLPMIRENVQQIIGYFGNYITILKPIYWMISTDKILHYSEICYMAKRIDMDPFEILLMQMIYEVYSACSVAVLKVQGKELFFRTMDWPMVFLKNITIGLNVCIGDYLIGKVTTWLGYVGFLTATSTIENYTMAINYRANPSFRYKREIKDMSTLFTNLYRTISGKWPIGYLIRHIIENKSPIEEAEWFLSNVSLISPCYITLYNPSKQTIVLTRDYDKLVNVRTTDLIQTNCDHDKDTPNIRWSVERRSLIRQIQEQADNNPEWTVSDILKELMKDPILNDDTIYVHYQYGNTFVTLV